MTSSYEADTFFVFIRYPGEDGRLFIRSRDQKDFSFLEQQGGRSISPVEFEISVQTLESVFVS